MPRYDENGNAVDQHVGEYYQQDETLRERSIREANEKTEKGKSTPGSVPASESNHPALKADQEVAAARYEAPEAAYHALVKLRATLGMRHMSEETARGILGGDDE